MALHLAEISIAVAPGAHAILLLDQAGWHVSKKLPIPDNITLLPFPPKSPELNPVENIWQFMRDNWLSNRIFKSHEDILDHCCFAWNKPDASKNSSRIGGALIQSVVSEAERGHGGMDAGVLRH